MLPSIRPTRVQTNLKHQENMPVIGRCAGCRSAAPRLRFNLWGEAPSCCAHRAYPSKKNRLHILVVACSLFAHGAHHPFWQHHPPLPCTPLREIRKVCAISSSAVTVAPCPSRSEDQIYIYIYISPRAERSLVPASPMEKTFRFGMWIAAPGQNVFAFGNPFGGSLRPGKA